MNDEHNAMCTRGTRDCYIIVASKGSDERVNRRYLFTLLWFLQHTTWREESNRFGSVRESFCCSVLVSVVIFWFLFIMDDGNGIMSNRGISWYNVVIS